MTALVKNKQTTHEIGLKGQAAILDLTGAMYLADHDVLLVADLHFEKGSSFARRGMMLPPYDTRETLVALCDAVFRFDPKTVIALGDSFHDIGGPERLGDEERATLTDVQKGRDWIWVTGNHDRVLPDSIGGQVVEEMALGLAHPAPRAGSRRAGGDRGSPSPGRQGGDARTRDAAALLPHRRLALHHAGARRLCRRAQRLRCRLQAALPERFHRASHRLGAHLRHREIDALPGLALPLLRGHRLRS